MSVLFVYYGSMLRHRITVTLEPDLVAAIDTLVDRQTLRNRSHAIEHLLKEGLGLHELEQAFFFIQDSWAQTQIEAALAACLDLGVREVFLSPAAEEVVAIIRAKAPDLKITPVPADFGSGGAILLKKEQLLHPALLFWVSADLRIPANLLAVYAFHRQHHRLLTQVIFSDEAQFKSAGVAILEPELAGHIPAGVVDLQTGVFPALAKASNVRAYVC